VAAATASNDTNDMKTKRRRINKSVVHRRLDDIERALDVFGDGVRDHLQRLRHDTFYDGSKRPDVATAAAKAEKRRGRRGGQRVQRAKRGQVAAVAANRERGVVASGDASPSGVNNVKTDPTNPEKKTEDPNPDPNPKHVVAGVEWVHPREMKLGQRRRLKTDKTEDTKTRDTTKEMGWRKRIKAVEWRACKAEDEVKRLKMENAELAKAVAAGGQPQVTDSTLKGATPEVINFCLQADVGVRDCQLRELRVQYKELQAKMERLEQRLGQETELLVREKERVEEMQQRLAAGQASEQQKLQRHERQIEQLVKQVQEQAEGVQSREQELSEVRAELQSRAPATYGNTTASAVTNRPSPLVKRVPAAKKIKVPVARKIPASAKKAREVVLVDGKWLEVQETVFRD